MRYRKPARPNPQFLYKGFLLVSSGGGYLVYDIGGKQHGSGGTLKEAQQSIDRIVDEKLKRAGSRAGRQAGRKAILDPASWERNPKHGAAFRARMYRLLEIRPDIFEGNQQLRNDFLTRGKTAFTIEDAHRVNKIVQAYMRIRPESLLSRRAGSNPAEKFPSLQRNKTMKLVTGRQYELDTLKLTGWTDGGGAEHEGYNACDYFRNGIYLGPDDDGIEPLFKRAERQAGGAA